MSTPEPEPPTPEAEEATQQEMVDLDRILRRVRALVAKAQHEATPPAEAEACQAMADALMLKYRLDQVGREAELPSALRAKAKMITIIIGKDSDIIGYQARMAELLAFHCRCQIRTYAAYTADGWVSKVYGYESDLAYFELLYTTVALHMLGVLLPKIDPGQPLEENAYRLHNAGYNWLEIAELYGWQKLAYWQMADVPAGIKVPYRHRETREIQPATQVGSRIKRAYHRAAKERGEAVQIIAANGSAGYRKSAANGYISQIAWRLLQMRANRTSGADLVLAASADDVSALFRRDNPDLFPEPTPEEESKETKPTRKVRMKKYTPAPINEAAWARGSRHAQSADLSGSGRVDGTPTREIR